MRVPKRILAAMRKTNALFCSQAVAKRDINQLDHVSTKDARVLPPGAAPPVRHGEEKAAANRRTPKRPSAQEARCAS